MFKKEQNSSKWQGKLQGENYPLTIADMDLPLYSPFKEKMIDKINDLNNLTYKNRSKEYFASIIQWYNKHHVIKNVHNSLMSQFQLKPQHFIESPSICNLIGSSILAFTKQKENVLIFTPVYSFYIFAIKSLNRQVICSDFIEVTQKQNNESSQQIFKYQFDDKDFERKMDQYKPKLIILCNPHNPSGKIFTQSELDIIVKKSKQYNTYILSDEIMGDFTLYSSQNRLQKTKNTLNPQNFISLINYSYPKIIIGNSISKVFNCESVQGGYGIIRSQQTRKLYNIIGYKAIKLLTNQMSLILTPIIYTKDGQQWISKVNKIFKQNFNLLVKKFNKQKCLKIFNLESGYLTTIEFDFTSINSVKKPTNQFLASVLAKFGIFFVDMKQYYYPVTQRNLFRIAIAIQPQQFEKFVIKFQKCINFIKESISSQVKLNKLQDLKRSKL